MWQECCPLIVMEACLRGIPCVSSDVFGLPEANANPNLVVPASLRLMWAEELERWLPELLTPSDAPRLVASRRCTGVCCVEAHTSLV